ncbi:MAG TPA: hypothetical protein ENJ95_14305 [Bacteroidetes bacterium]|nr:hypothetical protein [Bacteroidota bacterium]
MFRIIKHYSLLLLPIFLLSPYIGNAQLKMPTRENIRKAGEVVREGRRFVKEVQKFTNELERSTKEFNELVTVVKGDSNSKRRRKTKSIKIRNGKIEDVGWEPVVYFENELFPSTIVSLASYRGDFTPELEVISRPVGFKVISNMQGFSLRWEIECIDKRFFDKVSGEFVYEQPGREVFVMPEIPWNFTSLTHQISSTPVQLVYRLFDTKGKKIEKVIRVNMRSINDCIWRYRDTKMYYLFAAYVQESYPEIDNILKSALETKMTDAIMGYQGSEDEVLLQVAAIWKVLHDRGFQYSSITTPSVLNQASYSSQSVRTFESACKTSQANCVDGTVVLASVLRKIGISVEMVFVPGHCFLAFYADAKGEKRYFLETTYLGSPVLVDDLETEEEELSAYLAHFIQALELGKKKYDEYSASPYFNAINIEKARGLINSIPF